MKCLNNIKWLPSKLYNIVVFRLRSINVGVNCVILGRMFIRGRGKVIIGNNVRINSSLSSNPIGGSTRTIFYVKKGGTLDIGDYVGISNSTFYSETSIKIENHVFIGNNCKLYDSDFHSTDYSERISGNENIVSKPVLIKEGAFIGAHSIILKGVTIGRHSIIGAGAVVTKDVPDGEIWGGNPAQFIKKIKDKQTTILMIGESEENGA